jgi:hypothetical protein
VDEFEFSFVESADLVGGVEAFEDDGEHGGLRVVA